MTHRKEGWTLALAALLVLGGASLSGCNTVEGAGKDVEAAGNAMQRESCQHNDTNNKDCAPPP
ncbi:MAG TPA: entericidin A/B family lipoprotein [Nevskiaceae bacterium]|nr:entericidin A/B family lipoprotein [Nevskiaceae bacterium]